MELNTVKQSLTNVAQTTKEALRKANEVYDAALTLLTDVNGLTAPEIDIKKLKKEALEANEEVDKLIFIYLI